MWLSKPNNDQKGNKKSLQRDKAPLNTILSQTKGMLHANSTSHSLLGTNKLATPTFFQNEDLIFVTSLIIFLLVFTKAELLKIIYIYF